MESSLTFPQNEEIKLAYALVQSSIEGLSNTLIFAIDREYRYLIFNSAFKDAAAHAYGTVVERGVSMLETITDEHERLKAKANCDRALAGERHTTVEVYGVLHPSHFETQYNPFKNEIGEIIGVTILSRNVTEQKLAEEEIKAMKRDLEAYSYSVTHNLRAPLRVIHGYSGLLNQDHFEELTQECQRMLKMISGSLQKMAQLIEDLLNFAKLGKLSVNKQPIEMRNLIEPIVAEHSEVEETKKAEIKLGILMNLNGDKNLMRVVFSNLISNAIKYSGKKEKPVVEINSWIEADVVTYSVRDNGVGFDMKYADKLFGVFQRFHDDSEFKGTGMGLAIVHRIILKHGGKIWADAKVNEGATFYFSLPM